AVARAEMRRRADTEDRRLLPGEPEQARGVGQARVERVLGLLACKRARGLVRDVEAAEGGGRVRIGRGHGVDRLADARGQLAQARLAHPRSELRRSASFS